MNTRYYHTPLKTISTRARCPVCHESVYSRAGIHPQCAVVQSDPPKLRGKKKLVPDLLDGAATAPDQVAANVVAIPPTVEPTSASGSGRDPGHRQHHQDCGHAGKKQGPRQYLEVRSTTVMTRH